MKMFKNTSSQEMNALQANTLKNYHERNVFA